MLRRYIGKMVNSSGNIQNEKQMSYNDGVSVMKTASGLIKQRKGQSEDEYLNEKLSFWSNGPVIQNHTYVTDYMKEYLNRETISSFTEIPKIERETVLHGLERLYFQRDYENCLDNVNKILEEIKSNNPNLNQEIDLKKNKNIKRVYNQLVLLSNRCISKLQDENIKSLESQKLY